VKRLFLILCAVVSIATTAGFSREAKAMSFTCSGSFINPITDICWKCLFPISIGPVQIGKGPSPDTWNPTLPICMCPAPPPVFIRIGISMGLWEPVRSVDVTKRPWCFPNLGGISLDPGLNGGMGAAPTATDGGTAFWQVHWYMYPLLSWLNIITDFACMDMGGFDLAYVSEVDPLWADDELAFLLNPEVALFANPVAQAACALDCVTATAGLPLDALFWCNGCQGSMYPPSGRVAAHVGSVQSSLLVTAKMAAKLHRQMMLHVTSGSGALCGAYPFPVIKKSQLRTQMVNPTAMTTGMFAGNPLGRTSVPYEMMKEFPVKGEDFGYVIWQKRNCCVF